MSSITEQIKDKLDIVSYIQRYAPTLKKAGRTYKACCPFHAEKTPSFVVNPDSQTWRCYGACADGGDLFNFAMKRHGWTFSEALQELAREAGVTLQPQSPQAQQQNAQLDRLRGLLNTAAEYYHKHLLSNDAHAQAAYQYATTQRGFTPETITQFMIGYAPQDWQTMLTALKGLGYTETEILSVGLASKNEQGRVYDRFRQRLMIPIRDDRGRVTGFGARALNPDDTPKYLNSPQSPLFDKSRTLFGLDKAKKTIQEGGTAVIVEGYMDAIQAHQAGYTNVVAQMGTALTESQLRLLVPRYAKKLILALDADAAGQKATRRSLDVARETLQADYGGKLGVDIRILHIDDAKDPDDVLRETPHKWQTYIDAAKPVADFVIEMETAALPPHASMQERQAVAQNVLPLLLASEDNLYRQDNLQKLAVRLKIAEQDLFDWAAKMRRQATPKPKPAVKALVSGEVSPNAYAGSEADAPPYYPDDLVAPDYIPYEEDEDVDMGLSIPKPVFQPKKAAPAQPALLAGLSSRYESRHAEAYCLRLLLQNPTLLYQANRKLRELAQEQQEFLQPSLGDVCSADFSQSDYRLLFEMLLQGMAQMEVEPLEYVRFSVEVALQPELAILLQEETQQLQQAVNGRMSSDLADVLKKFNKHIRPTVDMNIDFLQRMLTVRLNRLKREQQDTYFLLREAQEQQDGDAETRYHQYLSPVIQGTRLLQEELHKNLLR